jgi:plastocyanin
VIASVRLAITLLVAGSVAMGCNATAGAGGPPPSAPAGGAVIVAQGIAFDRSDLAIPAGRPFMLLLDNRDTAPHNIRIYDADADKPLFVGEIFSGSGSRTYDVPAIPLGTYHFRCDVHTDMSGTVTAG